jgi:hypothetical protein
VPKTKSPGRVGHRRLWHGGSGWNLNRLALPSRRASSDSALILKLKLQVSDQLGQTLSRERVAGLSCQSAGLRQPSVEFFALSEIHFPCSCQVDGGIAKMFTELLSQR